MQNHAEAKEDTLLTTKLQPESFIEKEQNFHLLYRIAMWSLPLSHQDVYILPNY